jgi:hypothetical protein
VYSTVTAIDPASGDEQASLLCPYKRAREQAMKRIITFIAAIVTVAGIMTPGTAGATTLIVCVGPEVTNYHPPMTLELRPTSIHAEANYALCLGGPISATGTVDGQSPSASCLTISMPQVQEVVKFNTNQTEVIQYTTSTTARVGGFNIVTLIGTVTSGPHQGKTAVKTVQLTPVPEPTACIGDGLDQTVGITQLEILG